MSYQISRSFTTCACAIFMEQRNNNNNNPYGSWALSQWLTEQRGRGRRHQNKSLRGLKEDGTESERGAEWSTQSCDRVDWRWSGLMWVPESGAECADVIGWDHNTISAIPQPIVYIDYSSLQQLVLHLDINWLLPTKCSLHPHTCYCLPETRTMSGCRLI